MTKILNEGPEITIVFSSGDGLEANKTKINYNGLTVGTLTAIHLAPDHKHVIATAEMVPKAKDFLVKDLKFWVVKPRMSGLNVTGLGTLISGYYIGVQLGQSKESERNFTALESPPLTGDVPGRFFKLKTTELGSLGEGTPIYFRQIAGRPGGVLRTGQERRKFLNVKIFVQSPYDQYVSPDTRFWQASGVDLSLTAADCTSRPNRSCPFWRAASRSRRPRPIRRCRLPRRTRRSPCSTTAPKPSVRRRAIRTLICSSSSSRSAA